MLSFNEKFKRRPDEVVILLAPSLRVCLWPFSIAKV